MINMRRIDWIVKQEVRIMRGLKRVVAIVTLICLTLTSTCVSNTSVGAAASDIRTRAYVPITRPVKVNKLTSNTYAKHDYVKLTSTETGINVECETTLPVKKFSFNVRKAGTTKSVWLQYVNDRSSGGTYTFERRNGYRNFNVKMNTWPMRTNGDYVVIIMRTTGNGKNNKSVLYNNGVVRKDGNKFKVLQYSSIINNNKNKHKRANNKPTAYKDVYMRDVAKYVFRRPGVKKHQIVTKYQVAYFKRVSNKIVGNSTDPAVKARKIYQYAARHMFYDNYAHATKKNQHYNPYDLISHIENKKTTSYSSRGRVATVCIGFSGVVATLARAQGIPARIVKGHHLNLSDVYHTWNTEPKNIRNKTDHWWTELYINGKWHMVDANTGCGNKYDKYDKNQKWKFKGIKNYVFFMPTDEQVATNFAIHEILGGRRQQYKRKILLI